MSQGFKASNIEDLKLVARHIYDLELKDATLLVQFVIQERLMKAPKSLRLSHGIASFFGGSVARYNFWQQIALRDCSIILDIIEATKHHMLNGTDTDDVDSVGGFSQAELDKIVNASGCL
jgi:hypothetical protein